MDFYDSLKNELVSKNNALRALTEQSKIKGEYSVAIVRDFIRRLVSQRYHVGHGLVYNSRNGTRSKECDVIVCRVDKETPLFKSQDLAIVDSNQVRIVMQVKSRINTDSIREAMENLGSVKRLDGNILCGIFAFEATSLLKSLYTKAWKSGVLNFLHTLESKCKNENNILLNS